MRTSPDTLRAPHAVAPPGRSAAAGPSVGPSDGFVAFPREALERSIPKRFEEMARRYPDRLAVKTGHQTLSYDALNAAANRLAHAIPGPRDSAEEPIALLLEKGVAPIVAMLAALKAGRIYVPLDAGFPPERLRDTLEDSQAGLIVTSRRHARLAEGLARGPVEVLDMDDLDPGLPSGNLGRPIPPDAVAYIMYTSGSTGRPKGVVHSHRTALHAVMGYTNGFRVGPEDRLTFLYSHAFSASVKNVFGALLNGAALFPYDLESDGVEKLAHWLAREEITLFQSVASVFRLFLGTLTGGERFPRLRLIYAGSEPASPRDVALFKTHFSPECLLVGTFATNETGTIRMYVMDKETPIIGNTVPAGYAVEDKEVLLLDEGGNAVGPGGSGEIAVRSPYLALGYWRRPDLTRAAFLPDPDGGNARIYRTGDLGRLLPDGCLIHLGRKDSQIKVRGQKVAVSAIESVLLEAGEIKEAAVVAREDRPGDQRVVAYLVPARWPAPEVGALRQALARSLPEVMIPTAFVVLEALPRTPTGKVDRRALPAPGCARPDLGTAYAAPGTPAEGRLAAIWAEVLDLDRVGIHDDFFALGGHSLLVTDVVRRAAAAFQVELPPQSVFEAPTVAAMAALLRRDGWTGSGSALVPVQPGGTRPPLFCVHEHHGHLFCYRDLARHLGPDQPVYGLAPRSLDGLHAPHARIEDMAAEYIEAIRAVQPAGSYRLAGYCFGGTVALEMARQLRAAGQAVGLLALIETSGEGSSGGIRGAVRRIRRRLAHEHETLARLSPPERVGAALAKVLTFGQEGGRRILAGARGRPRRRRRRESSVDRVAARIETAHAAASRRYVLRAYPGRIVLFRPAQLPARFHGDPTMGWAAWAAGGLTLEEIPGRGRTIVEDAPARLLAQRLAQYLAAGGARP